MFFILGLEPLLSSPEISSCIQTQSTYTTFPSVNHNIQTPSTTTISFSTSPSNAANTNSIMCNSYLVGIGLLLVANLITAALCIVCILLILKKHFKYVFYVIHYIYCMSIYYCLSNRNEKLKVENQPSDIQIEQTQ